MCWVSHEMTEIWNSGVGFCKKKLEEQNLCGNECPMGGERGSGSLWVFAHEFSQSQQIYGF